jgi:acylphosphatase
MATIDDAMAWHDIRMERLNAVIRGDVQGVGFRFFITRTARPLGLRGWVRNNDDGSVELLAEGSRSALEQLLKAARLGPRSARVTEVEERWSPAAGGLETFDLGW